MLECYNSSSQLLLVNNMILIFKRKFHERWYAGFFKIKSTKNFDVTMKNKKILVTLRRNLATVPT